MTPEARKNIEERFGTLADNLDAGGVSADAPPEKVKTPLVGTGSLVVLRKVPALPEPVRLRVAGLSKHKWTEADWEDLLRAQMIVAHNVAIRHGLHEQHNKAGQT